MSRFREKTRLGQRWLQCGWRLFKRRPTLLLSMGLMALAVMALLSLVPFAGGILISLFVPVFLAGGILTADELAQNPRPKRGVPLATRLSWPARALFRALADDKLMIPILILCVYSVAVAVLINILAYIISGGVWMIDFAALTLIAALKSLAAWLVAVFFYLLLLQSLLFTVPLVCLRRTALVPAIGASLNKGRKQLPAILVLVALLLIPFFVGAFASYFSTWATIVVWVVTGSAVAPLFITSSYCSYRTLFPVKQN